MDDVETADHRRTAFPAELISINRGKMPDNPVGFVMNSLIALCGTRI
jgi:hypothetical protein